MKRLLLPALMLVVGLAHGVTPATAIFAGGCFWSAETDFEKLPGVQKVESGYIGGKIANPTYEQVVGGDTGHAEAVRVYYDAAQVSYAQLLDYFWHHIDPTVKNRQFCDVGEQYRSGIYYQNEAERVAAEKSKADLEKSGRFLHTAPAVLTNRSYPPEFFLEGQQVAEVEARKRADENPGHIYTEILPAGPFYLAEEFHQDYARKNPIRYNIYRTQCGRDARLIEIWGKGKQP